jgi:hypothetical protein
MPNVVLIIYESMNPLTYLIDGEFIDEHTGLSANDPRRLVTDTPFYNRDLMPHLREFAKTGITFSGMSSLGMPTVSGWISLLTGAHPSQSVLNKLHASQAHTDDLASYMRWEGFRSVFFSGQPVNQEAFQHWSYRRPAIEEAAVRLKCVEGFGDMIDDDLQLQLGGRPPLRDCDPDMILRTAARLKSLDFPKWYDYIVSYFPTEAQARILNLSYGELVYHDWYCDRILSRQFQAHWRQQRGFLNRTNATRVPMFAMVLDVESHMPYLGYDREQFYDGPKKTKEERFKRVNRYVDHWTIEQTLEYLKREDPNTIVVITGDHGTRDIPVRHKGSKVTDSSVFSGDCVGTSSGVDSFFVVSAAVGYLGEDPEVRAALGLDELAGKTFKFGTDHNDLIYTLMETISNLKGHSLPPTHRRSRNLVALGTEVSKIIAQNGTAAATAMLNSSGWQSISLVSYQFDYRNGSQLLRSHTADSSEAHYYPNVSYPTCLKRAGDPDMVLGGGRVNPMTEDAFRYLAHENYLLRTNRLYHYGFRDRECIANGKCEFPEVTKYRIWDIFFIKFMLVFPIVGTVIGFMFIGIIYLRRWLGRRRKPAMSSDLARMTESKLFTEPV